MSIDLIIESFFRIGAAMPVTIALAATATFVGFWIALLMSLMSFSSWRVVRGIQPVYAYIFRATPLLVQVFIVYYGSGQFRGVLESVGLWVFFREAWFCAILALALNTGAYASVVFRGSIKAVPNGQREAAQALGLSVVNQYRLVILPQALRLALPAYGNEIIIMLKATSLAGIITILEMTHVASSIIAETYRPVEVFLVAGSLYLFLNVVIANVVAAIEYWLANETRPTKLTTLRSVGPNRGEIENGGN